MAHCRAAVVTEVRRWDEQVGEWERASTALEERGSWMPTAPKPINAAAGGGIDDVIDPAETRSWVAESLKRVPPKPPRTEKKYPYIDTW